ncbi:two-component system sensor kinase [Gottschalkia acidurici 9a]|uniref:histidine kinase n=1 Tax=Gottschalkia acidurici (strain ATCC 7906 / DSM 604 / BCRC 14475 / CIP 104303 / KCTC 5404 / NCIMB 10678 / 9a) TaxID=1128398 RepID=K0B3J5_GOTA9|nr:HAMP domain-containing sensor histidine kinase [Gottschalkia acidurici]AFS79737.1 two-component system sensor kinase [Gottschalkia acidurici 9a]
MNQLSKALKKSLLFIIISIIVLIFSNIFITAFVFRDISNKNELFKIERVMKAVSNALTIEGTQYTIKDSGIDELNNNRAWSMLIDKDDGNVKWSIYLPKEIPIKYSATDVSKFSRYYLKDYPVFTWEHDEDLLVVGFPKDSYTKIPSNYYYIDTIKKLPIFIIYIILFDIIALLILFFIMDYFTMKKINPTVEGIKNLKDGTLINLEEKGTFAEINANLNKTAQVLSRKDKVRADWVTGVSHDVRTPLTMIIGNIDYLKRNEHLTEGVQSKLDIIENQCLKIKSLVNDLNLYSKIEHNTKFLKGERFNIASLLREIIVDYINNLKDEKYNIDYELDDVLNDAYIFGDKTMLKRALENMINNSMIHNPDGCNIHLSSTIKDKNLIIIIKDDGIGMNMSAKNRSIEKNMYRYEEEDLLNLKHGLGLIISKKIIDSHGGNLEIETKEKGGFKNLIMIPL